MDYDFPEGTSPVKEASVTAVAWSIFLAGGYKSETGGATALLAQDLESRGVTLSQAALNKLLNEIDEDEEKTPCLYGPFCRREMNAKRTFAILPVSIPGTDPFPPNPFKDVEPEPDDEDEVTDFEMTQPVDVEPVAPVSVADRLLFVASVLFECAAELSQPAVHGEQIEAVIRLTEENMRLRDQRAELEKANATLRRAVTETGAKLNGGALGRLVNA